MAASFAGVSFYERGGGGGQNFPRHGAQATTNVRHVPGGDRDVIQTGGKQKVQLALAIRCTASQLTSLRGKVGTSSTLTYSGGSPTAYLESVTNVVEPTPRYDYILCTLNYWI
jgi:hypothetical protein